jgi:hypothetical protein
MDERDYYSYGYAPVGERFYDLKSGQRQGRINRIAGYRDGKSIAPFTVGGACNRALFEVWLETCLLLNRIEKCWGWLKSRIRKCLPQAVSLRDAIDAVLKQAAS